MPRYYFDFIDDDGRLMDEDGHELPGPDAAYMVAHAMTSKLMQLPEPHLLRCRFRVRDSSGETVFELTFAEAITIPGRLN
ncbi:MAG TPA: hypothetical protein VGU45_12320 [Microvirga sp.]|jgi:hypothetical protein|nr:hypothetical protein [Microvirga sp.]